MPRFTLSLVLCLCLSVAAHADAISVICWNIERGFSPDANPYYVAMRVSQMPQYDLWGFSEVSRSDFSLLEESCEFNNDDDYQRIEGGKSSDHLLVVYNSVRLEKLQSLELITIEDGVGNQPFNRQNIRPPLGGKFKDKSSGQEFYFFVNHFHRGNAENRQRQSRALMRWAQRADAPVIVTGDFNFDWDIDLRAGNRAFDIFTQGNQFDWIEPQRLIKTQSSPRYNSILDFIFIAKAPTVWSATSSILVTPGDDRDNETIPDHRPVEGLIHLN
ncbi:MAG: hypothetical protein P9L94_03570 [Candidatus Hinthialibacter antarcticus]|nr:hypothetical protein [Candidatus Hinthialibacter antarcticus]